MVKVQTTFSNDTKQECWVELESDKIARHGTYTRNSKMANHIYFKDLYKLIEPVSTGQSAADPQQRYQ